MKRLGIVMVLGLAAFGCGKGGGLSMKSYKEDMCKCKDEACADKVEAKYEKWKEDQVAAMGKSGKMPSDADNSLAMDAMKCEMDAKMGK